MKTKVKLSKIEKEVAEWTLSTYREEKKLYEAEKNALIKTPIQRYEAQPKARSAERATENMALNIITAPYLRRMEISLQAVENTIKYCDEIDRQLLEKVYFRKTHSVEGAGLEAHISKTAAYARINTILASISYWLGYKRTY